MLTILPSVRMFLWILSAVGTVFVGILGNIIAPAIKEKLTRPKSTPGRKPKPVHRKVWIAFWISLSISLGSSLIATFTPSPTETRDSTTAAVPSIPISLTKPYLNVYTDADARDNYFHPTGYMGDTGDITVDERWLDKPHSGRSSIKVTYDTKGQGPYRCGIGVTPAPNCKWAGVYWQDPPNNWGTVPPGKAGFDLRGFQRLTFWARSDTTVTVKFEVGGIGWAVSTSPPWPDSLSRPRRTGWETLTNEWKQFGIDLEGADLSYVVGGFAWVTNWDNNEITSGNPKLLVFYLDDIRYER